MTKNEMYAWLHSTYLEQLSTFLEIDMNYMHTTMNWAVTTVLGGIAFVGSRPTFPDHFSYIVLLVLLVAIGHFAVRTGKAYLNVMRWSTLEKYIIKVSLEEPKDAEYVKIFNLIERYHCSWKSPLSATDVAYKLLVELGFGYFIATSIGLIAFVIFQIGMTRQMLIELGIALALLAFEVWASFLRSAYMKSVSIDQLARKLR